MRLSSPLLDNRTVDGRLNTSLAKQDQNGGKGAEPDFDGLLADLDSKAPQTPGSRSTSIKVGAAKGGQQAPPTNASPGRLDMPQEIGSGADAATSGPPSVVDIPDPVAVLRNLVALSSQQPGAANSPRATVTDPTGSIEPSRAQASTNGGYPPVHAPDSRSSPGDQGVANANAVIAGQDDSLQPSEAVIIPPPQAVSTTDVTSNFVLDQATDARAAPARSSRPIDLLATGDGDPPVNAPDSRSVPGDKGVANAEAVITSQYDRLRPSDLATAIPPPTAVSTIGVTSNFVLGQITDARALPARSSRPIDLVATGGGDPLVYAPDSRSGPGDKGVANANAVIAGRQDDRSQPLSLTAAISPSAALGTMGVTSNSVVGQITDARSVSVRNSRPTDTASIKRIPSDTSHDIRDRGSWLERLEPARASASEASFSRASTIAIDNGMAPSSEEAIRPDVDNQLVASSNAFSLPDPTAMAALGAAATMSMPTTAGTYAPDDLGRGIPPVTRAPTATRAEHEAVLEVIPDTSVGPATVGTIDGSSRAELTPLTGSGAPHAKWTAPSATQDAPLVTDVVLTTELAPAQQGGFERRLLSQGQANADDSSTNPTRLTADGGDEISVASLGQTPSSRTGGASGAAINAKSTAEQALADPKASIAAPDQTYESRKIPVGESDASALPPQAAKSADADARDAPVTIGPTARAIVDSVVALASSPASSPATPSTDVSGATIATPARTMTLQLSQGDLGPIGVRLRISGQNLDVELSVSDKRTAGVIDRERDALTDALRDQNFNVRSLVIQGSEVSLASGDSNAAAKNDNDGGTTAGSGQNAPGSQPRGNGRPTASPPRDPNGQHGNAGRPDSTPSDALFV